MKPEIIRSLTKDFESQSYTYEGIECWDARALKVLLGYSRWENFLKVIQKAKLACKNAEIEPENHFRDFTKMESIGGSQAKRNIEDVRLTRYACYLIAQNGDPAKEQIAFAMSYFAVQTRKFEILDKRINQLERLQAREKLKETEKLFGGLLYQRGIDSAGFGTIKSKGDQALFGGYSTAQMKQKLGVNKGALADHLPTVTVKAKDFAMEITRFNVAKNEKLTGPIPIEKEHVKNNMEVRSVLTKQGIFPEHLPAEEDIKIVDRAIKSDNKKLLKENKKVAKEKES